MTDIEKVIAKFRSGGFTADQFSDEHIIAVIHYSLANDQSLPTEIAKRARVISENTSIAFPTAVKVLSYIDVMTRDGEISTALMLPEARTKLQKIIEDTAEGIKESVTDVLPTLPKLPANIKWYVIGGLSLMGAYFAWPILKKMRDMG